ncbi:MAG TPA: hypothetical protein DDX98_12520 [Bacteroidales bacterium]|jgi:hypothetical protein|nr:hypothetical protein [Bacteroidales bacterium]
MHTKSVFIIGLITLLLLFKGFSCGKTYAAESFLDSFLVPGCQINDPNDSTFLVISDNNTSARVFDISNVSEQKYVDKIAVMAIPSSDFIVLLNSVVSESEFSYTIENQKGKILASDMLMGNETLIRLQYNSPEVFYLKVFEEDEQVQCFKILKYF